MRGRGRNVEVSTTVDTIRLALVVDTVCVMVVPSRASGAMLGRGPRTFVVGGRIIPRNDSVLVRGYREYRFSWRCWTFNSMRKR